jgi:hypothetical protein
VRRLSEETDKRRETKTTKNVVYKKYDSSKEGRGGKRGELYQNKGEYGKAILVKEEI